MFCFFLIYKPLWSVEGLGALPSTVTTLSEQFRRFLPTGDINSEWFNVETIIGSVMRNTNVFSIEKTFVFCN